MLQHVCGARQRKRSTWMNDPLSAAMQPHVDPNVRIHSCPGPRDQHMAEASRTINWKAIDDDGDLFPKRGYCAKDSFIDIDEVTRDAGGFPEKSALEQAASRTPLAREASSASEQSLRKGAADPSRKRGLFTRSAQSRCESLQACACNRCLKSLGVPQTRTW